MRCPQCQHGDCRVIESRPSEDRVRRRREGQACRTRFTTMERIEYKYPLVVKKDGSREPFDRDKVLAGFRLACRKRPVTPDDLEAAADRLAQRLRSSQMGELDSAQLGRMVLDELQQVDMVAYVRFASVYLEIGSAGEFIELLDPWLKSERKGRKR